MSQILANVKITFGSYRGLTGKQMARSIEGTKYLQWAHNQKGIDVDPTLLGLPAKKK